MNLVVLTGNLVRECELKQKDENSTQVASGTIAVQRKFDKEHKADFIPFVVFSKNAEYIAKYGKKGAKIEIVGSWQNREWNDKDENKRTTSEVIVNEISILSSNDEPKEKSELKRVENEEVIEELEADDLPF